jgi:hypothetical protein
MELMKEFLQAGEIIEPYVKIRIVGHPQVGHNACIFPEQVI